jgi:hypothetical protein
LNLNKLKALDSVNFSANNPALIAFEKLSRYILSPVTAQNKIQTCWFFERARGQYKTLRGREGFTKSHQRAFDFKYLKTQMLQRLSWQNISIRIRSWMVKRFIAV